MPKHRAGGKFSGSHSTLIQSAEIPADAANKQPEVKKVILGLISAQSGSSGGRKKVKITRTSPGVLRISVRGDNAHQEIFVYTNDEEATASAIINASRKAGYQVDAKSVPIAR
ncbi:MAG: DUF2103 domain-containing protein [Patescibacteria group bacterium]